LPPQDKLLWALLTFWAVLTVLFITRYAGKAPDDLFITFRYAENLANGHGFVYNPGERIFGLTNPGLGLLLAALHLVTRIEIPTLSTMLTGFGLFATVTLLLLEARRRGHGQSPASQRAPSAAIAGTLVLLSSGLWQSNGGAAPLVLAALTAAALLARRWPWVAGALAGSAVWLRPDAVTGAALLILLLILEKRKVPWRYAISCGLVTASGLLAATLYFGTPLPVTLASKRVLGELQGGAGLEFWPRALTLWQSHGGSLALILAACGIAGQVFFFQRSGRGGRLLVSYSLAMAIAYPVLQVPFFSWYLTPVFVALLYGVPYLTASLGQRLAPSQGRTSAAISLCLSVAILAPLGETYIERSLHRHWRFTWQDRLEGYRQAGEWIRENTPPEEAITMAEIGVVGYFSRRPVRDLMGLVTPEALRWVRESQLLLSFRLHPTDLVVWHGDTSRLAGLRQSRWFRRRYRKVATFPTANEAFEVVVYRRKARFRTPNAAGG